MKRRTRKDEELKTVKRWIDNKTAPISDELKRKSVKLRSKEKIGNIDVNVLQRELCKF